MYNFMYHSSCTISRHLFYIKHIMTLSFKNIIFLHLTLFPFFSTMEKYFVKSCYWPLHCLKKKSGGKKQTNKQNPLKLHMYQNFEHGLVSIHCFFFPFSHSFPVFLYLNDMNYWRFSQCLHVTW